MTSDPFVQMNNISKAFSGNKVLQQVDFTVNRGEIHALMGENGAGKSTLVKILTGIYTKDQGNIYVQGKQMTFSGPKHAEAYGISVIHQELNIIPHLTVAENMFLGKELTYGKTGILNRREIRRRTAEALTNLGVHDIKSEQLAGELSIGKQQMVEIAKALTTNAELIIMDEPTAALTEHEIENFFHVIKKLQADGVSIVYISHRMEEIFEICDRITVLRDGQYIGTKATPHTSFEEIVKMMVGRELGERYPARNHDVGEVVFQVKNLQLANYFRNISFSVREGEILGVAGLMGAGRSEVMEAIFGYRKLDRGTIELNGRQVVIKHPRDAVNAGIGFITEDRKSKGLIIHASIKENIALPNLRALSRYGIIHKRKESQLISELMQKLQVRATNEMQEVKSLSGGNQQKVVIAKWLAIQPQVLILDEPTRGVDIGAKKEIYTIMNELSKKGVAIIMISSELPEVLGISDRVMVMHEGKITAFIDREEADQESIMTAATGGA
ncbi:sugar ABC transporter ATP-binding protein [Virgibacillus chiguensis]|uniref:Ribose transport system ATP-binding protein n=1 Tax=Virgibacillus chiguensis TaxID=411959 RepID=A0A1M5WRV4_9BACI|nr:sugar ABC transporter ATP-binding protein [Virgibacillus chiguensis]SHH90249.1 ribose transport system ATP-binding protein [Virgibacillus chiguensis]